VASTKFLNDGMHHFDNSIVVPIYYCYFTLASIVGSSFVYKEYEDMCCDKPWKIPLFLCGVGMLLFGVWTVTAGGAKDSDGKERIPDEEQAKQEGNEGSSMTAVQKKASIVFGEDADIIKRLQEDSTKGQARRSSYLPNGFWHFVVSDDKEGPLDSRCVI